MNNPMFNMGSQGMTQMIQRLKQNPMQFIGRSKFNIPQNMMNDPQAMVQHLVSSGQVPQDQMNAYYQMVFGNNPK
jgi:hypothetical protein